MSDLLAENGMTFAKFIESVVASCMTRDSISFVNPQRTYRVLIVGGRGGKLPSKERSQCFDEQYLTPIAQKLGLDLRKTAKLLALRNAWIAYIQECTSALILEDEIRLLIANEIVADYIVLTSANWSTHPWMRKHPWAYMEEGTDFVSVAEASSDYQYRVWISNQEADEINFYINDFGGQKQNKVYASLLEKNAAFAEQDIKLAKKRVHELHAEIEEQMAISKVAMSPIRKFQNHERALKKRGPGHPRISEKPDQQQRRDVVIKFVEQWVGSLMSTLSITSCDGLSKMVGGQKMTWGRWKNKESLPSSTALENLRNVQIKHGEHKGKKLCDIQTIPMLNDLIKLRSMT